jgi:hypothetical protein
VLFGDDPRSYLFQLSVTLLSALSVHKVHERSTVARRLLTTRRPDRQLDQRVHLDDERCSQQHPHIVGAIDEQTQGIEQVEVVVHVVDLGDPAAALPCHGYREKVRLARGVGRDVHVDDRWVHLNSSQGVSLDLQQPRTHSSVE